MSKTQTRISVGNKYVIYVMISAGPLSQMAIHLVWQNLSWCLFYLFIYFKSLLLFQFQVQEFKILLELMTHCCCWFFFSLIYSVCVCVCIHVCVCMCVCVCVWKYQKSFVPTDLSILNAEVNWIWSLLCFRGLCLVQDKVDILLIRSISVERAYPISIIVACPCYHISHFHQCPNGQPWFVLVVR